MSHSHGAHGLLLGLVLLGFVRVSACVSPTVPPSVPSAATVASETTALPPGKSSAFYTWLHANQVRDLDDPDSHYDYRGAYLAGLNRAADGHFPDTFKQHGHPTFSVESRYSTGPCDGGWWLGEKYMAPLKCADR